jgi:hypothetical protein
MGNGGDWLASAERHHYTTSNNPHPRWIVVFSKQLPGSGGYGHVAVIESLYPDGTFDVSEMNYRALGVRDVRHVTSLTYVLGYFNPPGGPVNAAAALPVGQDIQAAQLVDSVTGKPVATSSVFDTLLSTVLNIALVTGGMLLLGAGIALAVFETAKVRDAVSGAQRKMFSTLGETARTQRRENRTAMTEAMTPKSVPGVPTRADKTRAESRARRGYGRKSATDHLADIQRERAGQPSGPTRAQLDEIPF